MQVIIVVAVTVTGMATGRDGGDGNAAQELVSRLPRAVSRILYPASRHLYSVTCISSPISRILYSVFRIPCHVFHIPYPVSRIPYAVFP